MNSFYQQFHHTQKTSVDGRHRLMVVVKTKTYANTCRDSAKPRDHHHVCLHYDRSIKNNNNARKTLHEAYL